MPVVATRTNASARNYGWSSTVNDIITGSALMKPTSVLYAGTGSSGSINTNGSIDFSTCTSFSINNCFNADYDNYLLICNFTTSATCDITFPLRRNGANNATASSYTNQYILSSGTSTTGARSSASNGRITQTTSTTNTGFSLYMYGPYLAQPTAWRSITMSATSSARISDYAGTHNVSTAYDGMTLACSTGTFSGNLSIYGLYN